MLLLHAGMRGERDFPSAVFKLKKKETEKNRDKTPDFGMRSATRVLTLKTLDLFLQAILIDGP